MDSDLAAPSFGTLLKQFRLRRQLTQLALAYKIGKKSRGSIQAWEYCRRWTERPLFSALDSVVRASDGKTLCKNK